MRTFLDAGCALIVALTAYGVAAMFAALPDIGPYTGGLPGGLLVFPVVAFLVASFWHMIKQRRWYWLMLSVLLGQFALVPYYLSEMRRQLFAQPTLPPDGPASLRSAGRG